MNKFKRDDYGIITLHLGNDFLEAQSVEANILLDILEKLEEIRCGLIDIENMTEGIR